jgi:hypothetical protein
VAQRNATSEVGDGHACHLRAIFEIVEICFVDEICKEDSQAILRKCYFASKPISDRYT